VGSVFILVWDFRFSVSFCFFVFQTCFVSSLCMGVTNLVPEVTNRKKSRGSACASPPLHSGAARRASRRDDRSERSEHCVVVLTCALLVRGLVVVASAGVSGLGPTWSGHASCGGGAVMRREGPPDAAGPGKIWFGQISGSLFV